MQQTIRPAGRLSGVLSLPGDKSISHRALMLSGIAFACGIVAGLAVALVRTSGNRVLERAASGYISLFQGTPLLMQLFVIYYGLALIGLQLDAWVAVTIGFTGSKGKALGEFCDHLFVSPSDDTPVVQQIHLTAAHAICDEIEQAMMRGVAGK